MTGVVSGAMLLLSLASTALLAWGARPPGSLRRTGEADGNDERSIHPPWLKGEANPTAFKGLEFTVPEVENLPDFHGNPVGAELVLFVGGNYFFAMAPLVAAFGEEHPELQGRIFYETLPPGILWRQMDHDNTITVGNFTLRVAPDVFQAGRRQLEMMVSQGVLVPPIVKFATNKLALMVPTDSRPSLLTLEDLGKPGVRLAMPNPETEGIARRIQEMLRKAGGDELVKRVYETKVANGEVILTDIHHRQTPMMIMQRRVDGGVTWVTEVNFHETIGTPITGVPIPEEYNVTATFAAALVADAVHRTAARDWLRFLVSKKAQDILAGFGFEPARPDGSLPDEGSGAAAAALANPADEVSVLGAVAEDSDLTRAASDAIKLVYHCDYLDPVRFRAGVRSITHLLNYHQDSGRVVKVAMVFHHHGINFLMKHYRRGSISRPFADRDGLTNHDYFRYELQRLVDRGVAVRVCHNTMRSLGLGSDDLWPFARPVASGIVWVTELQTDHGYAYAKVHD